MRAGHRDPAHRLERGCDTCGQYDRSPRHHHVDVDGRDHVKHLDCCAADGCPSVDAEHPAACPTMLERVGYAKDEALAKKLTALTVDHSAAADDEIERQKAVQRRG